MGLIDLTKDLDNVIAGAYSDARGPVVRGDFTELTLVQLDVGEGGRTHTHEGEQFVFVIEGLLRFLVGDDEFEVGTGQAAFVPSDVPHGSEALDRTRALSFKNLASPAYEATSRAR